MEKNKEGCREAYPFIRQVVRNAFHIESVYLSFPYTDIRQVDRGFRELVWADYDMSAELTALLPFPDEYAILVAHSLLEFINIACVVSLGGRPDVISLGPFSAEALSEARIQEIIRTNALPPEHHDAATRFYRQLPVASTSRVVATVQHLIASSIPEFTHANIIYRSFPEESHTLGASADKYVSYSAHTAELYSRHITEYLNAVACGDTGSAVSSLGLLLPELITGPEATLSTLKKEFSAINQSCCQRILSTTVHPYYAFEQMHAADYAIDHAVSREELHRIAHSLTHKYCLLVKNYALAEYSFLVRGIINYVNQHINDPLSLSKIAEHFHRNASYVSGLFGREMGCSLTAYIHQERIRHAIRYMNTSDLSISEIAHAVGIDDFAYFSRLFKKQVGKSPSEYRKMLYGKKSINLSGGTDGFR